MFHCNPFGVSLHMDIHVEFLQYNVEMQPAHTHTHACLLYTSLFCIVYFWPAISLNTTYPTSSANTDMLARAISSYHSQVVVASNPISWSSCVPLKQRTLQVLKIGRDLYMIYKQCTEVEHLSYYKIKFPSLYNDVFNE